MCGTAKHLVLTMTDPTYSVPDDRRTCGDLDKEMLIWWVMGALGAAAWLAVVLLIVALVSVPGNR